MLRLISFKIPNNSTYTSKKHHIFYTVGHMLGRGYVRLIVPFIYKRYSSHSMSQGKITKRKNISALVMYK